MALRRNCTYWTVLFVGMGIGALPSACSTLAELEDERGCTGSECEDVESLDDDAELDSDAPLDTTTPLDTAEDPDSEPLDAATDSEDVQLDAAPDLPDDLPLDAAGEVGTDVAVDIVEDLRPDVADEPDVEPDAPACPEIVPPEAVTLEVSEGDASASLDLGVDVASDWRPALGVDAPAWVLVAAVTGNQLQISFAGNRLPHDVWGTGSVSFDIHLEHSPSCTVVTRVTLDVANTLIAALPYNALPPVVAAAWDENLGNRRFLMLDAGGGQIHVLDTGGAVPNLSGSPIVIPSAGTVSEGIAVSPEHIFVINNDTLLRIGTNGGSDGVSVPLPAGPTDPAKVSMAWANGWLLVGEYTADTPTYALQDGTDAFVSTRSDWDRAKSVTTDGASLALWTHDTVGRSLWWVVPGQWATAIECAGLGDSGTVSVGGQWLAWGTYVTGFNLVAGRVDGTECVVQPRIPLEDHFTTVVGTSNGVGLAPIRTTPGFVSLAMHDLGTRVQVGVLNDQPLTGSTKEFVMAGLDYALVLTSDRPVLLKL